MLVVVLITAAAGRHEKNALRSPVIHRIFHACKKIEKIYEWRNWSGWPEICEQKAIVMRGHQGGGVRTYILCIVYRTAVIEKSCTHIYVCVYKYYVKFLDGLTNICDKWPTAGCRPGGVGEKYSSSSHACA